MRVGINYHWIILLRLEIDIRLRLEALKILNKNQEEALQKTIKEFEEEMQNDESFSNSSPDIIESYHQAKYHVDSLIIEDLLREQRYAMILSLFSFFEGKLKATCLLIEKEFSFKIKIDDLNGKDDLMKYWNYLTKVFDLETQTIEPYFTYIRQKKRVRNSIAHREGICNDDKLKKEINQEKHSGLQIDTLKDSKIKILGTIFIDKLIEKMWKFFEELLLAVNEAYIKKQKTEMSDTNE